FPLAANPSACDGHTGFFFFQAEDGIRDYKVTGVQTLLFRSRPEQPAASRQHGQSETRLSAESSVSTDPRNCRDLQRSAQSRRSRSEERRVGKGCRSSLSQGGGGKQVSSGEGVIGVCKRVEEG